MKLLHKIQQLYLSLIVRYHGNPHKQKRAIRKAKRLHKKTGQRFRVFFVENRYQVMNRNDIQQRKHMKHWGWHVNSTAMDNYCFFDTNNISTT